MLNYFFECFRSYKEDAYDHDLSESDEVMPDQTARSVDYENTDGIDRILDYRIDQIGS